MAKREKSAEAATELVELTELDVARLKSTVDCIVEVDRLLALQRASRVAPLEARRRGYMIQLADRLGVPESAIGEIDIEAGLASVDRGPLEEARRLAAEKASVEEAALVAAE